MKKLILAFSLLAGFQQSQAQITVTPNQTALQLANTLVATSGTLGVTVSNASLTCDSNANGLFTGVSNLGFNNGIVLGNGYVSSTATNVGINGLPSDFANTMLGTPGDAALNALVNFPTYDACVLEFDLQPVGTFVEFEYVFGSEEYPEFNCSSFNDVFAFFISGPGFATPTNIAQIPTTTLPVCTNNINDGTGGNCSNYTNLYVNNINTTITMDGFTVPLIAHANVTSGQTYHLKMAIADVADGVYNSYVVLKANSLKSGGTTPNGLANVTAKQVSIQPTVVDETLEIGALPQGGAWQLTLLSMDGRPVMQQTLAGGANAQRISMQQVPAGLYMVQLSQG
ncbi:MAG: hypothetical protein FGM54_04130, partial [Chitinophagaceae bacterium]|nr:hypothetical protein [Chitinophagaceae bacterium]